MMIMPIIYDKLLFAVVDNDYHAGPYNATFLAGQTSVSFDVTIIDDNILEKDEDFTLMFDMASLPSTITAINNQITVSILNDDSKLQVGLKLHTSINTNNHNFLTNYQTNQ